MAVGAFGLRFSVRNVSVVGEALGAFCAGLGPSRVAGGVAAENMGGAGTSGWTGADSGSSDFDWLSVEAITGRDGAVEGGVRSDWPVTIQRKTTATSAPYTNDGHQRAGRVDRALAAFSDRAGSSLAVPATLIASSSVATVNRDDGRGSRDEGIRCRSARTAFCISVADCHRAPASLSSARSTNATSPALSEASMDASELADFVAATTTVSWADSPSWT